MVKTMGPLLLWACSMASVAAQDPTAPLDWQKPSVVAPKAKPTITRSLPNLQSIVCSEGVECKAVLSGQVVTVGERISGYLVNNIDSDIVTLSRGDKRWNLELFALDIKQ